MLPSTCLLSEPACALHDTLGAMSARDSPRSHPVGSIGRADGQLLKQLRHQSREAAEGPRQTDIRVDLDEDVLLRVHVQRLEMPGLVLRGQQSALVGGSAVDTEASQKRLAERLCPCLPSTQCTRGEEGAHQGRVENGEKRLMTNIGAVVRGVLAVLCQKGVVVIAVEQLQRFAHFPQLRKREIGRRVKKKIKLNQIRSTRLRFCAECFARGS